MSKVTNIVFGDPIFPTANASEGELRDGLLTIDTANFGPPLPIKLVNGQIYKVQYTEGGQRKPTKKAVVDVGIALVVADFNRV
jgi:hypothetical protein